MAAKIFRITGEFRKIVGGSPQIEVTEGKKEGIVIHIPEQIFQGKEIPEATIRGRDQERLVNRAATHVLLSGE